MQSLFDVFGFVSVLVHGLDLVARTVLLGGASFALFGLSHRSDSNAGAVDIATSARNVIVIAGIATIATSLAVTAVNAAILDASLGVRLADVAGARFVACGAAEALAAAAIVVVVSVRRSSDAATRVALIVLAVAILCAAVAQSHAAARLSEAALLYAATLAHQLGAALWLGGLPCFRVALRRAPTPQAAADIGRRYSMLSIAGVSLIACGATVLIVAYIGSPGGAYGTAYGAMALVKATFFAALLLLGLHNFRAVRRIGSDTQAVASVVRFATIEMGVGVAVLMAAASMTSTPPAVDLDEDRVTLAELAARWGPAMPRLSSPSHDALAIPALQARLDAEWNAREASTRPRAYVPGAGELAPRNASDIAWSEYNHHWAGLAVLAIGIAALLTRSGHAPWSRHWPLLFVAVAVLILLRGDPEVWPMGDVGLVESLRDPEVLQHRVFALLLMGFAVFEWRVQTGRAKLATSRRVFPLLIAVAATVLLTHSHALGNVKEELLIETTHLPIAVLGVAAAWSRWLEVEAPMTADGRIAAWTWPACFAAIGLLLLNYREA